MRRGPSALARRRRAGLGRFVSVAAALVALALQLLVPIAHDPLRIGAVDPLRGMVLCHVAGAASPAAPGTPAPGKAAFCPICLTLQASSACLPPPAVASVTVAAFVFVPPPIADSLPALRRPAAAAQPRGPPRFA